jgi:hypothetical protein
MPSFEADHQQTADHHSLAIVSDDRSSTVSSSAPAAPCTPTASVPGRVQTSVTVKEGETLTSLAPVHPPTLPPGITPGIKRTKEEKRQFKKEKRKQQGKLRMQSAKRRRAEEHAAMSPAETEAMRAQRKGQMQETEARLNKALEEGLNVCVDLSFDVDHDEKEKNSLCKQLSLSYAILKKVPCPIHLHITSMDSAADIVERTTKQGQQHSI